MENTDDDEEINEGKIRNQDILTEEEILDSLDMTLYKERIENIIGRHYSYLFFDYFDNVYHSKTKNKISSTLTNVLIKSNKNNDSLWMIIYKKIKFYSKENVPILITKYFKLKAEIEFKFIYNESKKYTNYPSKFIDVYIRKMKKINYKKLNELKTKNSENNNIFGVQLKQSSIMKSFMSKKKRFLSTKKIFLDNEPFKDEHSDSSTKEEEIKQKKHLRTQIMKQIRQLKLKSIKEIEKANNIQNKQKKKYGGIKSRFLDVFSKEKNCLKVLNYMSNNKIYFNKYNDINRNRDEDNFPSSQRKKSSNNSKISYYNNYSKINSKYLSDDKSNNNYYYINTQSSLNTKMQNSFRNSFRSSFKKSLKSNRTNLEAIKNDNNKNKVSLFTLELNNKNNYKNIKNRNNLFNYSNKKKNNINILKLSDKFSNRYIKRPKSSLNNKKVDTKLFINKLEKKRNKEFLENLLYRNTNKDDYNYSNKIYELFKKTECF